MEDEHHNHCGYDFKNVMYYISNWAEVGTYYYYGANGTTVGTLLDAVLAKFDYVDQTKAYYTFSYVDTNDSDTLYEATVKWSDLVDHQISNNDLYKCASFAFNQSAAIWFFDVGDIQVMGNTFGTDCFANSFGHSCSWNSFGNSCSSNSFDNACSYNSFGNSCSGNSCRNSFNANSFGNGCTNNTIGVHCDYNIFGNGCTNNNLNDYCHYIVFKDKNRYVSIADGCARYITLETGCSYLSILSADTDASVFNYLQNVHIHEGVIGASNAVKTISIPDRELYYSTEVYASGYQVMTV